MKPVSKKPLIAAIAAALAAAGLWLAAPAMLRSADAPPADTTSADAAFEKKNYADAAKEYEAFLVDGRADEAAWKAAQQLLLCRLKLSQFGKADETAEAIVKRFAGKFEEARARRLAGNLLLQLPHNGTEAGGKFLRGEWGQGRHVNTEKKDRNRAVAHLEKAREIYAKFAGDAAALAALPEDVRKGFADERIECVFELAAAATRYTGYDASWYDWGGEEPAAEDGSVGEDDDGRGYRRRGRYGGSGRVPRGVAVDKDGKPIWETAPAEYSADLSPGRKMKFLLAEVERLDSTPDKRHSATALLRRALLSRARFAPERLEQAMWNSYDEGPGSLREQVAKARHWELADNQVYALLGSRVAVVDLPPDEDILALLEKVCRDFPATDAADEARYCRGLHFQNRRQYVKALAEYEQVAARKPESRFAGQAGSAMSEIRRPEAGIEAQPVRLAGEPVSLPLRHRNVTKVSLTAHELDLAAFIEDAKKQVESDPRDWNIWLQNINWVLLHDQKKLYEKYRGKEVARWDAEVKDDDTHRPSATEISSPLQRSGCYLIEGRYANNGLFRNVLLVSDLAIVEKRFKDKTLIWTVDARTGRPVQTKLDFFEFGSRWVQKGKEQEHHWFSQRSEGATNDAGLMEFSPRGKERGFQLVTVATAGEGENRRFAFSGVNWWNGHYNPSRDWEGFRVFMTTDRPVYRPGQKAGYRIWARGLKGGEYRESPGVDVQLIVRDPRGNVLLDRRGKADDLGGLAGDLDLAAAAPLGMYNAQVKVNGQWAQLGGGQFRVEEYKKPEFEVTVDTAKSRAKLGEKVEAKISARYYFGAPVTEATVKWKVMRSPYTHLYASAGEWDWLYGRGYGRAFYAYDWLPGWRRWSAPCCVWYPWWGAPPKPERELVAEGESPIGADGTVTVTVDTSKAAADHPDSDHRYAIEAEVRDASRRTITGGGTVTATRQEFYAYVESDRGWYRPGDQATFRVRCLTADDSPRAVKGKVTVTRLNFVDRKEKPDEQPVQAFDAETDADGKLRFDLKPESSGQFRVAFTTKDEWGGAVEGAAVVWVVGADFDGTVERFTDLELISDKRTYAVGETARIMLNAKHAGATVLFSDAVDGGTLLNYRLIPLPKKSTIIELPITKAGRPNFFVEATTVHGGKVFQDAREILVPPVDAPMNVTVKADRAEYKPGQKGRIEVVTTDTAGKPVSAQVALSVFDKSVLYIQGELAPEIRSFFWGQKRNHYPSYSSSLAQQWATFYSVGDPSYVGHRVPPGWSGSWGPRFRDFANMERAELKELSDSRTDAAPMRKAQAANEFGAAKDAASATGGLAAASPAAPPAPGEALRRGAADRQLQAGGKPGDGGGAGGDFAEATVRSNFADTALWSPTVVTDAEGKASVEITFPENLTGWKIRAHALSAGTRVGSAEGSAVTAKNLLVRLQAPRFFVERDEVVLSANVHNYLKTEKTARVSIKVNPELMALLGDATVDVKIPAGGEKRVDWVVRVLKEGKAGVTMTALTDEESDAMAMTFPVLVHGIDKMVAAVGSLRPDEQTVKTVSLVIPQERKPAATKLEVRFSPSLAGAMIDALPYLIAYPYGCTEQTMSRFLPAVVTAKTLQRMGVKLEDIAKAGANLNAQEINGRRPERFRTAYAHSPVFDSKELDAVIKSGLERLYGFQLGDGSWGWWANDRPNTYLTAYVVYGLHTAVECDVKVRPEALERGFQALLRGIAADVEDVKVRDAAAAEEAKLRKERPHPTAPGDQMAFSSFVLSLRKLRNDDALKMLFERRDTLGLYGKALLCLTFHKLGEADKAKLLLENVRQYREEDKENETVWFRTPQQGWWWWYNNPIEANAYVLKALAAVDPKSDDAPRLVKWLLNNRRHGTYWRSTRDTAITVQAMGEYIRAVGEDEPDYTLTVKLDGKEVKKVRVTRENFFTFDNALSLEGEALTSGKHELTVAREGKGAVYFSSYLSYFTTEEDIKGAGLELKVERKYYRLDRVAAEATVDGARGQDVAEKRLRWKKTELKNGDAVKSGDLIQVELKIASKNDYDYLCFEDFKPAGCEPVEVRSGGRYGELCSNMELRDERVVFFIGWLAQGEHTVTYRVRAEVPGVFHALPTKGHAMYAPELSCNSDEMLLKIRDEK
jgi:uncharacterized protein YfaS (alpha-2-macroglobulin family)